MLYEVINPSDTVTFEAADRIVAAVVCILLGNGQYALDCPENPDNNVPLFMFGGFEEWWKEKVGDVKTADYIRDNTPAIAASLETCLCMSIADRKTAEAAREHMREDEYRKYAAKVNEERRSSMNDICGRAFKIAERLRQKNPDLPTAPRQVFGS